MPLADALDRLPWIDLIEVQADANGVTDDEWEVAARLAGQRPGLQAPVVTFVGDIAVPGVNNPPGFEKSALAGIAKVLAVAQSRCEGDPRLIVLHPDLTRTIKVSDSLLEILPPLLRDLVLDTVIMYMCRRPEGSELPLPLAVLMRINVLNAVQCGAWRADLEVDGHTPARRNSDLFARLYASRTMSGRWSEALNRSPALDDAIDAAVVLGDVGPSS